MKFDEFAFFNQQLSSMLESGIPLEDSLKKLSRDMKSSYLKKNIEELNYNLQKGYSLENALERGELPHIYKKLLKVAVKSENFSGTLSMIANYYQKMYEIKTKLKGMLVYPFIVLIFALIISFFMTHLLGVPFATFYQEIFNGKRSLDSIELKILIPPIFFSCLFLFFIFSLSIPACKRYLRWKLSPIKAFSFAQLFSSFHIMIEAGCSTFESLEVLIEIEKNTSTEKELLIWKQNVEQGKKNFFEGKKFPAMISWILEGHGENLQEGLKRVSEMYYKQAVYSLQIVYSVFMPTLILILGVMLVVQAYFMGGQLSHILHELSRFL